MTWNMKVYISGDHGGFNLKLALTDYLKTLGYYVIDLGPHELDPTDDYPTFASTLARAVKSDKGSMGIILCRSGVGASVVANRFASVRCALSFNPKHVKSARNDDDANVLALPADYLAEGDAKEIVKIFLETPFDPEERFVRRLKQIEEIEKANE